MGNAQTLEMLRAAIARRRPESKAKAPWPQAKAAPRQAKRPRAKARTATQDKAGIVLLPVMDDAVVSYYVRRRQGANANQSLMYATLGHYPAWQAERQAAQAASQMADAAEEVSHEAFSRLIWAEVAKAPDKVPLVVFDPLVPRDAWRRPGYNSIEETQKEVIRVALALVAEGRLLPGCGLHAFEQHLAKEPRLTRRVAPGTCRHILCYGTVPAEWRCLMGSILAKRRDFTQTAVQAAYDLVKRDGRPVNLHQMTVAIGKLIGGKAQHLHAVFQNGGFPAALLAQVRQDYPDVLEAAYRRKVAEQDAM